MDWGKGMIKQKYDDGKKHIHVLSFGAGTQSTAMLLMALKGEIQGVIPDYIIFSDTGWEPQFVYDWMNKVNNHIKLNFGKEIIIIQEKNLRDDLLNANTQRLASIPFYTLNKKGEKGMVRRQCTGEYKIAPISKKIRELLGYESRKKVREVVHIWKGISTDEIQRVKPSFVKWQVAEHPLVDYMNVDRQACISYVEREGLGTPAKSSCIGCPFHSDENWLNMKRNDPQSWEDAVIVDRKIRNLKRFDGQVFLHRQCVPLDQVELRENQIEFTFDGFTNECEGMCGL